MRVGLGQELYAACLGQSAEAVEYLGGVATELLDSQARDRESYFEFALHLFDESEQQVVHRQVALGSHALHNRAVYRHVEIVVVLAHIEEPISFEPQRLMNLKI